MPGGRPVSCRQPVPSQAPTRRPAFPVNKDIQKTDDNIFKYVDHILVLYNEFTASRQNYHVQPTHFTHKKSEHNLTSVTSFSQNEIDSHVKI